MLVNIRIYLFSAFLFFAVGLNSVLVRIHWKFVAGLVLICTWVAIFIAIIFSLTFSNYVLICLLLPYKNRHYNLFTWRHLPYNFLCVCLNYCDCVCVQFTILSSSIHIHPSYAGHIIQVQNLLINASRLIRKCSYGFYLHWSELCFGWTDYIFLIFFFKIKKKEKRRRKNSTTMAWE